MWEKLNSDLAELVKEYNLSPSTSKSKIFGILILFIVEFDFQSKIMISIG